MANISILDWLYRTEKNGLFSSSVILNTFYILSWLNLTPFRLNRSARTPHLLFSWLDSKYNLSFLNFSSNLVCSLSFYTNLFIFGLCRFGWSDVNLLFLSIIPSSAFLLKSSFNSLVSILELAELFCSSTGINFILNSYDV